jgi:hypothetical protein
MGILDTLPGIIDGALTGAGLMRSASISRANGYTSDGRGGRIATHAAAVTCRALVVDYSDAMRGLSNGAIMASDRKAIVMGASLSVAPSVDDVFIDPDGREWKVIRASRDPAGASYELQLRPAE